MTLSLHDAQAVVDLLLDAAEALNLGPHEGCPCDQCHPNGKTRRELRKHLVDAAAEVVVAIAHARMAAAMGCRVEGCAACAPRLALTFVAPDRTEES